MNKKVIVVAGLLVVVGALAFAGITYAQTPTPPGTPGFGMMGGYGYGRGRGLGAGTAGGMMNYYQDGELGPMHDAMLDALAQGLGLTRADLDSRIAASETPYEIATAQGLSQADFAKIMIEARQTALEQAVAQGYLTQAQADWMLSHMRGGGFGYGWGGGNCPFHNAPAGSNS